MGRVEEVVVGVVAGLERTDLDLGCLRADLSGLGMVVVIVEVVVGFDSATDSVAVGWTAGVTFAFLDEGVIVDVVGSESIKSAAVLRFFPAETAGAGASAS